MSNVPPAESYFFVSYAHENGDFVERLVRDLEKAGISTWVDNTGLKLGTPDWEEYIRETINLSRGVILVASPNSRQSHYVTAELSVAEENSRTIYPVWAEGDDWTSSADFGRIRSQYVDMRTKNYEQGLVKLIEALRGELPIPSVLDQDAPIPIMERIRLWVKYHVSGLGATIIILVILAMIFAVSSIQSQNQFTLTQTAEAVAFKQTLQTAPTPTEQQTKTPLIAPTAEPTSIPSPTTTPSFTLTYTYTPSSTPTDSPTPTSIASSSPTPVTVRPVIYKGWQATDAAISIKPSAEVGEVGDLYGTFDFATVSGPNPKATYSTAFIPQDWSSYRELQMGALFRNGAKAGSVKITIILWTGTGSQLCFYEHGNYQLLGSGMNAVKFNLHNLQFKSCTDAARGSTQYISPLSNASMVSGMAIVLIPVSPGNVVRGAVVIDDIRLVK